MAEASEILAHVVKLLAPPERMPLAEWADKHRQLSSEASAAAGPWSTLPFQREPLDAIGPGSPYESVVLAWASQLGKSEMLMSLLAYVIAEEPGPVLLVEPTLSMAEAFSKDRIAPMARDTPALRGKVADPKGRDAGSTIFHRRFTGGHLTMIGANSPAGLAARPIRYLLLDECDRYEESAGAEGDPISLATARTRTFWNRKIVLTSSPTIKGASRIETAWLASDRREYFVPCPHCEHFQTLTWERMEWPKDAPLDAAYRCEACNALIPHHAKDAMVGRGRWQPTAPGSRVAGFRLSELVSPWRSWGLLAEEFVKAEGDPEMLRVFRNTSLAEWWTEEIQKTPEAETLAARVEVYGAEVPAGGVVLTCGVDIQSDRVEAEVLAWGAGFESWSVGYFVLFGNPEEANLWAQLDALLAREFKHQSGMPLRIAASCIDSGYATDEVLQFARDKFARKIFAVKGMSSGWSKPVWPRRPLYSRRQIPVFLISSDEAKRWFFQRLRVGEPGPNYCHFPIGRPLDYFRGLVSETLMIHHRAGRVAYEWKNLKRERNEPLDARVYAIAALFSLLAGGLNLDSHAAAFAAMLAPPAPGEKPKPNGSPGVYRSKFIWGDQA